MAKVKSVFFCTSCGNESAKWLGKCPACGEWNTMVEETYTKGHLKPQKQGDSGEFKKPEKISEVTSFAEERLNMPDSELNRVLGGGLVKGSLVLLAGEPGIGKSTLSLQFAINIDGLRVLYVSGEESAQQISQRAARLGQSKDSCYIMTATDPDRIIEEAKKLEAEIVIIDSIQTLNANWLESSPGSVSQIKESAASLMRFAKSTNVSVFLIGHITKEGSIAGPKVLEHMVDTVLVFEGDQHHLFRLLRCTKNRFGSTNELGIYQMNENGLKGVVNPSELLLSHRGAELSGSAAAVIVEGARPLIIEVQALVSSAVYGTPQRSATGYDVRRLHMLLAVLEKRCGFKLGAKDVFLNIAGGIKVNDPSIDLAVVAAILSSSEDLSLPSDTCFAAEVGLSGEIRPVTRLDQRIAEAGKIGFKRIFISNSHTNASSNSPLEVIGISKVQDMLRKMFA
jgi:DNA repair protein RadA/Sms